MFEPKLFAPILRTKSRPKTNAAGFDLFKGLLNSTSEVILAIDRNYNIIALNNAARMAFQATFDIDASVGTSILSIFPESERGGRKLLYDSILNGEPCERETITLKTPKGDISIHELTYYLISDDDGDGVAIAMFIRNITKLRQAEARLMETRNELQAFMNYIQLGVFVIDKNGTPYFANDKAKEMLGKGIIPTKDVEQLGEVYQAYKAGTETLYPVSEMPTVKSLMGEASTVEDMEIRNGDKKMLLEVRATPVYDTKGNLEYAIAVFQDITKRKAEEEVMMQNTKRLAEAQRVARIGDFDFNLGTGELKWSDEEYAVLGIDRSVTPDFGVFASAIHTDDRQRVIDEFQAALGNSSVNRITLEFRVVHQNGDIRYTKGEVVIVRNEHGAPTRAYGTNQDITEQKLAEEKLRQQQLQMNAAADLAKLAFWEGDLQTQTFLFNDRCFALLGTTVQQEGGYSISVQRYLEKYVLPEDVPISLQHLQAVLENPSLKRGQTMYRIRRADDGTVRYIKTVYNVERNAEGVPVRLFGPIQDVTEQEEALLALRQSEENFRKTTETVPGMLYQFMLLPDGTVKMPYVSEGSRDLYGLEPEQIMENPMLLFGMMNPDDIASSQIAIGESAANMTPFIYDTRYTLPDGRKIWTRYQGKPTKCDDGLVVWYGINIDITKQKELEAELEARLKEIQETQNHLIQSEKMSALGQMVAGVAHELNTPIGYASNNVALIHERFKMISDLLSKAIQAQEFVYAGQLEAAFEKMQEVSTAPNGTLGELEETIRRTERLFTGVASGFDQMSSLVKSMRNFSRLDEADMKKADLNEGLRNCLLMIGHQLKDKSIELTTDYGDIPAVDCYPAQLNQVFLNLIGNAIHAVEEKPNGKVHVQTALEEGDVVVRVIDNGKGIPKHVQKKIFDPFFTTKPVGKGTGLGLSICYNIVQKHNGKLYFETEEGEGTTFFVRIPAVEFLG